MDTTISANATTATASDKTVHLAFSDGSSGVRVKLSVPDAIVALHKLGAAIRDSRAA